MAEPSSQQPDETGARALPADDGSAAAGAASVPVTAEEDEAFAERPAETRRIETVEPAAHTAAGPAQDTPTQASPVAPAPVAPVPVAPAPQQPLAPAVIDAPPPPKRRSNRLAGTAWVLLAAGLFELLYFGALAALIWALSGPAAVGPGLDGIVRARWAVFTWLPVLFFFLLFELTVLIAGRSGRFFYVVTSGIVAILVFVLSVLLILVVVRGSVPDQNTVFQTLLNPTFILVGVVAREVMLWTGFAIGARGRRILARDRRDRERYERELAERSGAGATA